MQVWQLFLLYLLLLINVYLLLKSKKECRKNNSFGLTYGLTIFGMFVWGDVLVLSLFWMLAVVISLFLQDWTLFLLIVSSFWLVRSLGETIYWFLQQFAVIKRDKPENLVGFKFVKNESIWFIYQLMWQCITVGTLITTVYLFNIWLSSG